MFGVVNCYLLDNLYRCLESCYWHLIEKRFCFDESIALYEEPVKKTNEKNNNMFDNMAFFDSISVIAGRAIVTIDPLPEKKTQPIMRQPHKRLNEPNQNVRNEFEKNKMLQVPYIVEEKASTTDTDGTESDSQEKSMLQLKLTKDSKPRERHLQIQKSVSFHNIPADNKSSEDEEPLSSNSSNTLSLPEGEVTLRKKSLRERRMSKSLYLKIDYPKELPIIRQNSMPKFYLDTPQEHQTESSIVPVSSRALRSPMTASSEFTYDLYSVVQMEKSKSQNALKEMASVHRNSSQASKFFQIKGKITLKKSKSTVSASNVPYSNYI